jgi:hypothetical protein
MMPLGIKILVLVELFLAFTSIISGAILLADPSGKTMGIEFMISYMRL